MSHRRSPSIEHRQNGVDVKRALLAEMRAADAALAGLEPDKAIHAGRVHLKRVRAIARLAAPTAPWTAARINHVARDVMASLSPHRTVDALRVLARKLANDVGKRARRGLEAFADALDQERAGLSGANLAEAREDMRTLIGLARALPHLDAHDARSGFARLRARAARSFRRARKTNDAHARHVWRKREKDVLYTGVIVAAVIEAPQQPDHRLLSKLTDRLGQARDVSLMLARLRDDPAMIPKKSWRKAVRRALRRRVRALNRAADRTGRRLHCT